MSVVEFPPQGSPVVELGPQRRGHQVIVDGRAIPLLFATDHGSTVDFILDDRFSYEVPREWSKLFAAAMAQAMAIGAGYPHLGTESRERPFAPRIAQIEIESH